MSAPSPSRTILVADDEPNSLMATRLVLERFNVPVLTARDGNEALGLFRENADRIAVAVLDVRMPGLSGIEVFHEMRELRPDVRVIFLTGHSIGADLDALVADGLAEVLEKPVQLSLLLSKVEDLLEAE